jgi:hypothetical protein
MISFELLYGPFGCFHSRRGQSLEKGIHHSLIDLDASDVQTVDAASLDDILARAMIARRRVSAAIVGVQPPATLATCSQALQQCSALSHRAAAWCG